MTADIRTIAKLSGDERTALRRFILVALVVPMVVAIAGAGILLALTPSLPDPMAVHWGTSGRADGFAPVWVPTVLLLAIGLALPMLLSAMVLPSLRRGERGLTAPFLAAMSCGMTAFLTVLVTLSTAGQAGVVDAADAPTIWVPLVIAVAAGAALGTLGWFLQPRRPFEPSPRVASVPAFLAEGERAVWLQRVSMARSGLIVLWSSVALLLAMTVVTWIFSSDALAQWVMLGATLLIVLAVATNTVFQVRVDEEGLTVASTLGWPRVRVPLADVETASTVEVTPMAEFGGWGMRWAPNGRFGVVLRTGEGIAVRRRNGKSVTVTVDDAETGAALLVALASR